MQIWHTTSRALSLTALIKTTVLSPVDRYDYIVNGEALKEIHAYMEEEHKFSDYTVVSMDRA